MTFPGFTQDSLKFLANLKANNTREWFADNKKTYETEIRQPAREFAAEMADSLEQLVGESLKTKIFRINRDIRFSKDKTPYNSHVHISWIPDRGASSPAWMFGLSPDYLTLGCGVFEFDKAAVAGRTAGALGDARADGDSASYKVHGKSHQVAFGNKQISPEDLV